MNGCEKSDAMISYYNIFESKTLKWWKRFFYNFFFFKSDKDKCLFLSHEGTTKISPQKLKKNLINKLIILSICFFEKFEGKWYLAAY